MRPDGPMLRFTMPIATRSNKELGQLLLSDTGCFGGNANKSIGIGAVLQARLGKDMVIGIPGVGHYESVGLMTLAVFEHALEHFDSSFILKVGGCCFHQMQTNAETGRRPYAEPTVKHANCGIGGALHNAGVHAKRQASCASCRLTTTRLSTCLECSCTCGSCASIRAAFMSDCTSGARRASAAALQRLQSAAHVAQHSATAVH